MATLIVTVEVEEDMPEWRVQAQTTTRNLQALPTFQAMCERLGVRPTYLCTWPAVVRPECAALGAWSRAGRCEVGADLHPWVTPPFDANENRLVATPPNKLGFAALQAKIAALTSAVRESMGVTPRSFRAAGGGLNGACLQAIERHGYEVDCSVAPLTDGRPHGGVDHRAAPDVPYFPDRQLVDRRGSSPVLEVPLSVGFDRVLPELVARSIVGVPAGLHLSDVVARLGGGERITLQPVHHPMEALCRLAEVLVARDVPTLHLSLRSSELVAGASGGPRTEEEARHHLEKTERVLAYAVHTLGAIPRTLGEFRTIYVGGG